MSATFFVHDEADKSDPANEWVAVVQKWEENGKQKWAQLFIANEDWPRFAQAIIDADTARQMP